MKRLLFLEAARSPSGAMPDAGGEVRGHGGHDRMTPQGNQQWSKAARWLAMAACTVLAVVCGIILCRMIPGFCNDISDMAKRLVESIDWRYFQIPIY